MNRMRIAAIAALAVGAAGALAAGIGVGSSADDGGATASASSTGGGSTATVERRDLVERETVDGTLGYAGARTVVNNLEGTLTRMPSEGSVVRRGESLYEVDGLPSAHLLYGRRPAWRAFESGMDDGADVRQLEENLVELGYAPGTVDETFTDSTEAAVEAFQDDRGHEADGRLELGGVVFLPQAARIASRKGSTGMRLQPGQELLSTTSSARVVEIPLPASRQSLVARGDAVEVELPDGDVVEGRVSSVSRVAQGGPEEQEPTVTVKVKLRGGNPADRLDQAPVAVGIAREEKKDVLAVPVAALLALEGGGNGVEVVEPAGRRTVPVETGLFADGYVEVSGRGLRDGTRVAVPDEL